VDHERAAVRTIYHTQAWLKDTRADLNLYFNTAEPAWGQRHLDSERPNGIEAASVATDPGFCDLDRGDFHLAPGSPALLLGFIPTDPQIIGLQSQPGPCQP